MNSTSSLGIEARALDLLERRLGNSLGAPRRPIPSEADIIELPDLSDDEGDDGCVGQDDHAATLLEPQ